VYLIQHYVIKFVSNFMKSPGYKDLSYYW